MTTNETAIFDIQHSKLIKVTVQKPSSCSDKIAKIGAYLSLLLESNEKKDNKQHVFSLMEILCQLAKDNSNFSEVVIREDVYESSQYSVTLHLDKVSNKASEMILWRRVEEAITEAGIEVPKFNDVQNKQGSIGLSPNNNINAPVIPPRSPQLLTRSANLPSSTSSTSPTKPEKPPKPNLSLHYSTSNSSKLSISPKIMKNFTSPSSQNGDTDSDQCNSCRGSYNSESSDTEPEEDPKFSNFDEPDAEMTMTPVPQPRKLTIPSTPPIPEPIRYKDAVEESIGTEEKYLQRLQLLNNHYYENFKTLSDSTCDKDKLNHVFGTFANLIQVHELLVQAFRNVKSDVEEGKREYYYLGEVWKQYFHVLKVYKDYFNRYESNLQLYGELILSEEFKNMGVRLQKECPNTSDRALQVTSHLLEPIQRIPRYPLLLDRYIKEIGDKHPDYEQATQSLDQIKKITDDFNSTIKETERSQKALLVLKDISYVSESLREKAWGKEGHIMLNAYVDSENVMKISSKNVEQHRLLILFKTILLVSRSHTVIHIMPMNATFNIIIDDKLNADYANCLRLKNKKLTMDVSFNTTKKREQWVEYFRKLGIAFTDTKESDVKFPWEGIDTKELGFKAPMKLKDKDVSQCQACGREFTTFNRRHHCRFCGGIFCGECSIYLAKPIFSQKEERCCFFCKKRLDDREKNPEPTLLSKEHLELIEIFKERQKKFSETVASAYFEVKFTILKQQLKADTPDCVIDNWCKMWCTIDKDNVLNIFKMKNDSKVASKVILPLSNCELLENAEIKIEEAAARICHLKVPNTSSKVKANQDNLELLNHWNQVINRIEKMNT